MGIKRAPGSRAARNVARTSQLNVSRQIFIGSAPREAVEADIAIGRGALSPCHSGGSGCEERSARIGLKNAFAS